jgi:S1-C subfamily serine protease
MEAKRLHRPCFRSIVLFAGALALAHFALAQARPQSADSQIKIERAVRDLNDADPRVRGGAIVLLSDLAPQQHAPEIAARLSDDDADVVETALDALADMGAKQYAAQFANLLGSSNSLIEIKAMRALAETGAAEYASRIAPFLHSGNKDLRDEAVYCVGRLHAKQYASAIVPLLKDGDREVRSNALKALAAMDARQYAAQIAALLNDAEPVVRSDAVYALSEISAKEYAPAIARMLLDEQGYVREGIATALKKLNYLPSASDVFQSASDAVVKIVVKCTQGTGLGAGFAIGSDGRILTNKHVVEAGGELGSVLSITVYFLNGGVYQVRSVRKDPHYDLALIQLENPPRLMRYLHFEESLPLVGDELIMIGHPAGLDWSLSEGKVSQIRSDDNGVKDVWIQTDGAINQGNSGGPMLNRYSQIVGISTSKMEKLGDHPVSGLNFGISALIARKFALGY